jgi:hypothetical protein
MGEVINFPGNEEFKNVSYIDVEGDLGVITKCRSIGIFRLNKSEFEIVHDGASFILDRDTISEFLHVSQVFVDPDSKHKPELEMIACDY